MPREFCAALVLFHPSGWPSAPRTAPGTPVPHPRMRGYHSFDVPGWEGFRAGSADFRDRPASPLRGRGPRESALSESRQPHYPDPAGSVAEWFKALVLKTSVGGTLPWVRIPPLPPVSASISVLGWSAACKSLKLCADFRSPDSLQWRLVPFIWRQERGRGSWLALSGKRTKNPARPPGPGPYGEGDGLGTWCSSIWRSGVGRFSMSTGREAVARSKVRSRFLQTDCAL
jgi:hypothetical protein